MKKIYFSLIAMGLLLFAACNSNEVPGNEKATETGTLSATISFEGTTLRAASTAIPTVSWANVKQVQVFLYDRTTGRVAFSRTERPTAANPKIKWTNVPVGNYRLVLLANVKSSSDNMATSIDGTLVEFTDANVVGKVFNSTLKIDLKETALPATMGPATHNWDLPTTGRKGYLAPSEVFTASKDITIAAGGETVVPATDLVLRREIAMMRVRVNTKPLATHNQPAGAAAKFNTAADFITVQRLPVGLGLPVGSFAGGILDAASDDKRVLVGATGASTYKTANPAAGYIPNVIIDSDYTLWNDIHVLPNASQAERTSSSLTNASTLPVSLNARKYFIIISTLVGRGYKYADGSVASGDNKPVYWFGTIDGVFSKNVIREVNMKLTTAGYPDIPDGPGDFGLLEITVGAPENWNSTIVSTDIEV